MIKLRPYQEEARYWVNRQLNSGNNPLLVKPTGCGKTKTAIVITKDRINLKKRLLILCPQIEIFDQWIKEASENGLNFGYINDEGVIGRNRDVYICMVQSLNNLLNALPEKFCNSISEIITDECHRGPAQTYKNIYYHFNHSQRIGLTATPYRMDNKPLGEFYNKMFEPITMNEAIEAGYLCKPVIIVPDEYKNNIPELSEKINREDQKQYIQYKKIIGDVVKSYRDIFNGLPVIVPCINHEHAKMILELFKDDGWDVEHIHSKMTKNERKKIIKKTRLGQLNILITVGIGIEGMDIPGLYGIIWLRFTESLTIFMQLNGRAMRPAPSKQYFIFIDPVGNSVIHGRPDTNRKWSLENDYIPGQDVTEAPISRICNVCGVVNSTENNTCWICGYNFQTGLINGMAVDKKTRKLPKMIDGELIYLDNMEDDYDRDISNNNNSSINNINNSDHGNNNDKEIPLTKAQKMEILSKDLTGLRLKNKFKEGLKWL